MKSLRTSIIAAALVFVVLLSAATAALVRNAEKAGREQTRAQILYTTRALALVVDSRLQGYERLLSTLAASEAVQRNDFAALDRQARAALNETDAWITLADRDGNQIINTGLPAGAPLPKGRLSADVWTALDTGRPRVCNLARGMVEKQISCVDLPIMREGRAAYKLSVVFRPRLMQQIIDAQRVPRDRYATILDREGRVIWRSVEPDRFVGGYATPDMLERVRSSTEGLARSRSLDGALTEAAFSRSPASGWTFITAVREAELAAASRTALRDGAVLAGALLAAAVGVALLVAHLVGRDLGRLSAAAKRIRGGDPPAFETSRFEEFAALSGVLETAIAERDDLRERFALAQEVGGVGSWDWDLRTDIGRVSETYKEMHGLRHVEGPLKFADLLQVIHPDDRSAYLAHLRESGKHPESSANTYRVLRPDGSVRWIAARGRPIFDTSGAPIAAVGIVRDVTAEHEAEAALRRLNELLEQRVEERTLERDRLWNIAKDPFVVADESGVWLAASPAWTTLLGYPLTDFIGRTSQWLEHPDDIERTRAEDRRLGSGLVTERFENRFRAKDGTYKWLSWTAVPEAGRFYSVARDVTAEKEQARALEQAEAALREAQKMESIGHITGGVAHDFNNLLTPILGTFDLLQQRGLPDARSQRMVANAMEATERARTLVQRLLAFARRQPLRTGPVDLAETFEQVRPLLKTSIGPQIRVVIDVAEALPPVMADAQQFELALLNLAVNARDAMPEGGTLTVRAARSDPDTALPGLQPGRYVEVSVSDTGLGMSPSVLKRAIEPFFSTKGLGKGTGLGLSMVHGLVAQLGGGMDINSTPGEGSTIRLWLPVAGETARRALEPAANRAPATPAKGRVLLVDDEALPRASTGDMLIAAGYEVVEASSAAEALARLAEERFDFLVTDHLMPGMTGAELAREARTAWPNLQSLIVSGYADVDDIAPDLPRLPKPFTLAELLGALAKQPQATPA